MVEQRKKVLLITDSFPPRSGGASVRMRGLAKYLPRYGWDPTILTIDLPAEPEDRYRIIQVPYPGDVSEHIKKKMGLNPQEGLQNQLGIPDQVSMAKEPFTGKIFKRVEGWITYPDQKRLWKSYALAALRYLLNREKFQALISSSPPVITHLIGAKVKDEFRLPWIADMRDLWSQNYNYPYGVGRKYLDRLLEKNTLLKADALVTVSSPLRSQLELLHPVAKISTITNSFDPDDCVEAALSKKFTMTYTGQIYQGKQQPAIIFKVLSELLSKGIMSEDNLEVCFYGPYYRTLEKEILKYNLQNVISQNGLIPRDEALDKQRKSQILILLNWVDEKQQGVYTGKIFEYLAARRPILALGGSQDVVSELLHETNAGIHPRGEVELKAAILSWYEEFQEKGFVSYQGNEQIYNYSQIKMAQRFAELLNEVSQ